MRERVPTEGSRPGTGANLPLDVTGGAEFAAGVEAQAGALGVRRQTQFGGICRRFVRNRLAVLGAVMILIVVLTAVFAPLLAPYDPRAQDLANTQAQVSAAHLFGTDEVGRDQLSRVIYGARIALLVGLSSIVLAVVLGVLLGALAGYFGRACDSVIMRVADIFFAFPLLIGAIVIITVVGQGVPPVIIALGVFSWATVARLLRSSILSVRESDYVEAARSLGASRWRIVTRHILPNSMASVLVFATFSVGTAVVAEAALSFLGVGVKPDVPEWGTMIAAGEKFFGFKDFLWLFPCLAVVFTVLGFILAGDGLRDALDPKLK
jgi:ABC-type dipeptide/oligopeptide/nickel transport system permease subunit